jgi:hypothetical protein
MGSLYKIRSSYHGRFGTNSIEAKHLSHSNRLYGIFYRQNTNSTNYDSFWTVRLIQGNSVIVVLSECFPIIIKYNIPLAILFGEII